VRPSSPLKRFATPEEVAAMVCMCAVKGPRPRMGVRCGSMAGSPVHRVTRRGLPTMTERRIKGLGEIALRVHDLDAMQRFYEQVIGPEVLRRSDNAVFFKLADGFGGHTQVLSRPAESSRLRSCSAVAEISARDPRDRT
jgi:hypothetical protein